MFDNGITLTVGDTQEYLNKIRRNMIGFDDWISDFDSHFKNSNYPPYNTIKISNHEYKVEVALAGFKKDELKVYTQEGKLIIEGNKTEKEGTDYMHRGLAQRSFKRSWAVPDDLVVKNVNFEDFSNQLNYLLNNLNINKINLVGFSFGSLVALKYAKRFKKKVKF